MAINVIGIYSVNLKPVKTTHRNIISKYSDLMHHLYMNRYLLAFSLPYMTEISVVIRQ